MLVYEITGGFRGFAMVPAGVHYVSVMQDGSMQGGFWCVLDEDGVAIRVFDDISSTFKEDSQDNVIKYTELALCGAMNKSFIPVLVRNPIDVEMWASLTKHLTRVPFPPELHLEQAMSLPTGIGAGAISTWFDETFKSRFELAFLETHKSNIDSFMAEFEWAYLRMLICDDKVAGARWRHLILASFNAGEHTMRASPDVFSPLVDAIVAQISLEPDEFFQSGAIGSQGSSMVEDLVDTENLSLATKGDLLATALQDRGISFRK